VADYWNHQPLLSCGWSQPHQPLFSRARKYL